MKKDKNIHREVDETMKSLDGIERAKTDDFFYSRLTSRLEHREEFDYEPEGSMDFGFTFVVAAVLIIMSLNLLSFSQYLQDFAEEENGRQEFIEELTTEYTVLDLGYYNEMDVED